MDLTFLPLSKLGPMTDMDRFVLQAAWCTVQPAGSQSVGWHQDGSSAFDFKSLGYPVPLLQLRASFNLTDQSELFMGNIVSPFKITPRLF